MGPEASLRALKAEVGEHLSQDCYEVLAQELGVIVPKSTRRQKLPAGLTDREVEILGLLAQGLNNRQLAQELVITEKTVEHHLSHVYNKIGISSRAAAVFFALEHELIS